MPFYVKYIFFSEGVELECRTVYNNFLGELALNITLLLVLLWLLNRSVIDFIDTKEGSHRLQTLQKGSEYSTHGVMMLQKNEQGRPFSLAFTFLIIVPNCPLH